MMLYVIVLCSLSILIILGFILRGSRLKQLTNRSNPLVILYPISILVMDLFFSKTSEKKEKQKEALRAVTMTSSVKEQYEMFQIKRISMILVCIIGVTFFSLILETTQEDNSQLINNQIKRPQYGDRAELLDIQVRVDGEQELTEDLTIQIGARKYTQEQFNQVLEEAQLYLEEKILGKNENLNHINKPLNLISKIPTLGVNVKWQLDQENIIKLDGSLENNFEESSKQVQIIARIEYEKYSSEYTIPLTILRKELTEKEQKLQELQKNIELATEDSEYEEVVTLPTELEGAQITYEKPGQNKAINVLVVGMIAAITIGIGLEQELLKKKKERDQQILMDYPDVINKFVLLLSAGMTVIGAWKKIIDEYQLKRKKNQIEQRYAYEEMILTWQELQNNINEARAFENFGVRMKVLPYIKFSSLLAQNSQKGLQGLLVSMQVEAMEAYNTRKETAKRLGEEAGTKMLLPMGIMLLIVIGMILYPAFMAF